VRLPVGDGETRVELRPRTSPVVPGRVVGIVTGPMGKPIQSEVAVECFDERGDCVVQHVVSDGGGQFVLEGVPPGRCRLRWNAGEFEETIVPEDGDSQPVQLIPGGDARRSSFVVTDIEPATAHSDDPAVEKQLDALRGQLAAIDADRSLDASAREVKRRETAQEMQRVLADAHAALPRRDVVVTGLPTGERTWLRLETRPRDFRRVEAKDGVARFPSVPTATYSLVVAVPGKLDRTLTLVVPAGEGAFETSLR
jgi:hypothetical protein